jgi:hypothetical protein
MRLLLGRFNVEANTHTQERLRRLRLCTVAVDLNAACAVFTTSSPSGSHGCGAACVGLVPAGMATDHMISTARV